MKIRSSMNKTLGWKELLKRQRWLRDHQHQLTEEQKAETKDLMAKLWLMIKG